ncbi:MAG: hypothetical protein IJT83_05095, partial [Victivallales bacterium]|nr:hypothetical protein [Victivallales bacterium]
MTKKRLLMCLFMLMTMVAFAANVSISIDPSSINVQPGQIFTVNVLINSDTGLQHAMGLLQWNPDLLSIDPETGYAIGEDFDGNVDGEGWVVEDEGYEGHAVFGVSVLKGTAIAAGYQGVLSSFTFTVKEDVPVGTKISLALSMDSSLYGDAILGVKDSNKA